MPQQGGGPRQAKSHSLELKRPDREQGKEKLLFVLRKFLFLKRAHGLNHKTNNANIYGAKLSNPIPKKVSHWF